MWGSSTNGASRDYRVGESVGNRSVYTLTKDTGAYFTLKN